MASTEASSSKRRPRKLVKKRKPQYHTLQYPKGLEVGDDAEDDVTAYHGQGTGAQHFHLNQSVLSLLAVAGSKTDLPARFDDDDDSGSETEQEGSTTPHEHRQVDIRRAEVQIPDESETQGRIPLHSSEHNRKRVESRLLRSLPKLNVRTKRERDYMSQSMILPPRDENSPIAPRMFTPRDAPVMSQILEAEAQLEEPEQVDKMVESLDESLKSRTDKKHVTLEQRLMEIFNLKEEEEVAAEYPCWLMQSVLLQGFMYITSKHICFYAYLPKKSNVAAKTGYLSKRGKSNPKYNRYWFTLKGDVLSYYKKPGDLYFPSGTIDLRYGISAALSETEEKGKDTVSFSITTQTRIYHFKADSPASAKEWVKTLQKVIFRSHNDGDSVKISLPLDNVVDIEESPVLDYADTFKVRVIENDETFAIDEYYFSFFSFGKDALNVLRALIDDTPASRLSADLLGPNKPASGQSSPQLGNQSPLSPSSQPVFRDSVRATLSPLSQPQGRPSPRASGEWSRKSFDSRRSMELSREINRVSFDHRRIFDEGGKRSASTGRMETSRQNTLNSKRSGELSDDYVHSIEPSASSSTVDTSTNGNASASHILARSDVFHSPTINRFATSPDRNGPGKIQHAHTEYAHDNVVVSPPSRSQTDKPFSSNIDHHITPRPSTELQSAPLPQANSSSSLQQLVKGSFPMQKAAGFAGYLRRNSRKMSSLLSTESMNYMEKVSGMWAGGRKHYGETQPTPDEAEENKVDADDTGTHENRFRAHFSLDPSERLQATFFGCLYRVLPLYGKIYIGDRHFCYRSLLPGTKTILIVPLSHIENVTKERGLTSFQYGLVIRIRGYEEIFFEFGSADGRDDCTITLLQNLQSVRHLEDDSDLLSPEDVLDARQAKEEHRMLQEARLDGHAEHELNLPKSADASKVSENTHPILFDDPRVSIINFKPTESLRITCLTIGSRGDVQPYIALCKGLMAEGHKPRIATHNEFEPWIREHGIDFAPVDGEPAELMKICVDHGMFTLSFLKEASSKFRGWVDELLISSWKACQDTDILIESPSAMAGIHIAEALEIPYFRAFSMPWTRTRAYPHAFAVPERRSGGTYNVLTYIMFDNVFWAAISGQVNRWRKKELGLGSTTWDKLHANKVPFLYNFSPSVVVPPLDYSDWIRVTGYWFLDEGKEWTPPEDLANFIKKARQDKKKLVYIGFGSIVVSDPAKVTNTVVESVLKADVRCILSKGWSDRLGGVDRTEAEVPLPPEILQIKSAPHDWLFTQIDAAAHHGGSGTTGASLRAGLPTIIRPFFGDQYFFGARVDDLGVGICMKKFNVSVFSRALWEATNSERMIIKARVLGEQIRKEHGVETAIQAIYRDLEYAKTLIKRRKPHTATEPDVGDEESWTFIGDESDPDLLRRIQDWEPYRKIGDAEKEEDKHTGGGHQPGASDETVRPAKSPKSPKSCDNGDNERGTLQTETKTRTQSRSPLGIRFLRRASKSG